MTAYVLNHKGGSNFRKTSERFQKNNTEKVTTEEALPNISSLQILILMTFNY
jgi:hypothetical protein